MIESEGLIKSHCRIDVVIRHKEPLEQSSIDKFQIQLFDHGSSAVRGHKQVISQVLPGKPMVSIVFFDDVEGLNRRMIDEAGGRVCNPTISPRHRGDK